VGLTHAAVCDLGVDCTCAAGKILYNPKHEPVDEEELWSRWTKCESCGDWWCLAHHEHVFECDCPSVHEVQELEAAAT